MFTRLFWKLTAERAVKTFAQTLASALVVGGVGLLTANWPLALSTAGMAAVGGVGGGRGGGGAGGTATAGMAALVSVLTSIGSLRIGTPDSPSVVRDDPPRTATPVAQPQVIAAVEPVGATAVTV